MLRCKFVLKLNLKQKNNNMKKTSVFIAITAIAFCTTFQSCTNNSSKKIEMQKPTNEKMVMENESETNPNSKINPSEATALNMQNMLDAFKGETTASAKYAAYSQKAEQEGYHEIAMLFKAASISENIHANNHKVVIEEAGQKAPEIKPEFTVKTTAENLKDALSGERYELSTMYPEFMKNASISKNQLSLVSLDYAYKTEQKHKVFYEKALAALENNTVKSLPTVFYICSTCGNTYETTAPKRCGISMTSAEKFIKITDLNS